MTTVIRSRLLGPSVALLERELAAASTESKAYSEDEARDEQGRWTSGGMADDPPLEAPVGGGVEHGVPVARITEDRIQWNGRLVRSPLDAAWKAMGAPSGRAPDEDHPERYEPNRGFGVHLKAGEVEDRMATLPDGTPSQYQVTPVPWEERGEHDVLPREIMPTTQADGTSTVLAKVPGSERPLEHVYRVVSDADFQQAAARGFMQSDQRMNLADEGTVASDRSTGGFYTVPGDNRIVRIDVRDGDGWKRDPTDDYIKTPKPIPFDRISLVSPVIRNDVVDTRLNPGGGSPTDSYSLQSKAFDPDQPRDEHGEWTSGGGSGSDSEGDGWKQIEGLSFEHDRRSVSAYTPQSKEARFAIGRIFWYPRSGEIMQINVRPEYQRMGLATELLRQAREVDPRVHHSAVLSDAGRAWSAATKAFDPSEARDEHGEWTSGGDASGSAGGGRAWSKADVSEIDQAEVARLVARGNDPKVAADHVASSRRWEGDSVTWTTPEGAKASFAGKAVAGKAPSEAKQREVLKAFDRLAADYPRDVRSISVPSQRTANALMGVRGYGATKLGASHILLSGKALSGNGGKKLAEAVQSGWFSPAGAGHSLIEYTLTHEYGHCLDTPRGGPGSSSWRGDDRPQAVHDALMNLPATSRYGETSPDEKYAEAFTEWRLSGGKTDSPLARELARLEGWK